jgi:hypothetical protein
MRANPGFSLKTGVFLCAPGVHGLYAKHEKRKNMLSANIWGIYGQSFSKVGDYKKIHR